VGLDGTFLASVASIVLIDLLLAGDNAVVIAVAVRGLEPAARRRGILLGAGAAVVLRIALTFFVSQLLQTSFVKLAGGVLVLWIAFKLFVDPEEAGDGHHGPGATSTWSAVKLIVVADVTMSLDNMLAVGGASGGHLPLLVFGLAVSIPFVVLTSDLLSRLMNRFPVVVYVGAAVLGRVSAEMILTDPFVEARFHPPRGLVWAAEALLAVGILVAGRLWSRRAHGSSGEAA
jgi:YjbE family integral membrane protein